jgi:hypothetical protein
LLGITPPFESTAGAFSPELAGVKPPKDRCERVRPGRYRGDFTWSSNPVTIRVRSSLGGTATRNVTLK